MQYTFSEAPDHGQTESQRVRHRYFAGNARKEELQLECSPHQSPWGARVGSIVVGGIRGGGACGGGGGSNGDGGGVGGSLNKATYRIRYPRCYVGAWHNASQSNSGKQQPQN